MVNERFESEVRAVSMRQKNEENKRKPKVGSRETRRGQKRGNRGGEAERNRTLASQQMRSLSSCRKGHSIQEQRWGILQYRVCGHSRHSSCSIGYRSGSGQVRLAGHKIHERCYPEECRRIVMGHHHFPVQKNRTDRLDPKG